MIKRHLLSFLLVTILLITVLPVGSFASEEEKNPTAMAIESLLEKRLEILSKKECDEERIKEIDSELVGLGVEFLTNEQVATQFPEAKSDRNLALNGETGSNEIKPQIGVPSSSVNTWMSYRTSNFLYNGKRYNIQTLTAHPKPGQTNSKLVNIGSRIVTFDRNWKVGTQNLIKSVASSAAGNIPGASLALSVYDAFSSFISGISTTTEINAPNITYSWSTTTSVTFEYVRLESQSDSQQLLSYIGTKVMGEVGYMIPTLSARRSGGSWVAYGKIEKGGFRIYAQPPLTVPNPALYGYINGRVDERVREVVISGPESKSVQTIYPHYPIGPAQIEF